MFHKAVEVKFNTGTELEVKFQSGEVKRYDISVLFPKYPQLEALKNHELFASGKLLGFYGIWWNDELDLETETVYEDGITIRTEELPLNLMVANAVLAARARAEMSQSELSALTGIDQSDISRIERGLANPSVGTLNRIAIALGAKLTVSIA